MTQFIFKDRWHVTCRVLLRLVILSFGNNLGDDSFGYWWQTCYVVTLLRDWNTWYLDQYMDIVGVCVELGFMLFTLDIDQYLDVTDLVGPWFGLILSQSWSEIYVLYNKAWSALRWDWRSWIYSCEYLGYIQMIFCRCWVSEVDILDHMLFEDDSPYFVMISISVDLLISRILHVLHV